MTQGDNTVTFTNPGDGMTYTVQGFPALPGYDLSSGVGTIDAAYFVPALAGRPKGPHHGQNWPPGSGNGNHHGEKHSGGGHGPPAR